MAVEDIDLTPDQRETAIHLFTTRTTAKIVRRRDLGNGEFELYPFEKEMALVDFPTHPEEFALTGHRQNIHLPLSKVYINLRNMKADTLALVGRVITGAIPDEDGDAYGIGIPDAGTDIGHAVAKAAEMDELNLFVKAPADSQTRLLPHPEIPKGVGQRVILFDDLITEAHTKLDAISVAEKLGYRVIGVAVLVDREQGGRQQLEERGYELYAAMRFSSMLRLYLAEGLIDQVRFNEVEEYLAPLRR